MKPKILSKAFIINVLKDGAWIEYHKKTRSYRLIKDYITQGIVRCDIASKLLEEGYIAKTGTAVAYDIYTTYRRLL